MSVIDAPTYYHVTFKVLTVVLLWIQVIWDMTLCCWATFDGNVIMQKHWQLCGQWQCHIPGDCILQHTARLCYCGIKQKYGCQLQSGLDFTGGYEKNHWRPWWRK